ncbi:MAG: hypothetical protein R3E10_13015 [Gemmatimonadota bacterium]
MARRILGWTLCMFVFVTTPLLAQSSAAVDQDVFSALASHRGDEARARDEVRATLDRPEVSRVAERMGLDLEGARDGVELLDGDALDSAQRNARTLNDALDQERTTISFRTTTLIILLLVLILLVLVV